MNIIVKDCIVDGYTHSGAAYSSDEKYRYILIREWDSKLPTLNFIGLNPSTATEIILDNTIRRVVSYCKLWGFGKLIVTNIFAYRATNPIDKKIQEDPIGKHNDKIMISVAQDSDMVLA